MFQIIMKFDTLRHFFYLPYHDSTFMNKHKSFYELIYNDDNLVYSS